MENNQHQEVSFEQLVEMADFSFDDKKVELKELHNNILSGGSSQPNQWSLGQSTKDLELLKTLNYKKLLNMAMQSKSSLSDYTIDKKAYEAIKNFKPY